MKKVLLSFLLPFFASFSYAQLLTWSPPFPVEDNPAQTLAITLDATKGNGGLLNQTPTTNVYVHIGVLTNLSTSSSDWKYVKFTWATTPPAAQATYLGNNKLQYTITGSLRQFFGITNSAEKIQKIALLFRSGDGAKKQTNSDGSDMYVPVYSSELTARIDKPGREPRFVPVPEAQTWTAGSTFAIEGVANRVSELKLFLNGTLLKTEAAATSIGATGTVSALGNQQIILSATEVGVTKFDTLTIFVAPPASPTAALPAGLRDGINYDANNTAVTLVLSTPAAGKNIVSVLGDFNNWQPATAFIMNRTADGKKFWLRIEGLTPGTEYGFQYLVDNALKVADPYAEKILDPYNNNDANISVTTYPGLKPYPEGKTTGIVSILQTAAPVYNWAVPTFAKPNKKGLIIYELLLRDFIAAHDWKTLKDTLSYLKTLGVNAIELLPFNEFEGNLSWGYNPDFYFAPDKYYGPKNDLKRFIDSCHKNGMAVIMDIALNHSFGLSPMVQLYFDAANNRPAANNPWYNPIEKHPFNVGYDFNHESLDTRYFTSRVVEHWLQEYKIDGFRFDLSKGFTQNNTGTNVEAWGKYDASRVAIWKRYYDTLQVKAPGAYAILEHFADNEEEKELSDYGMLLWGNLSYNYQEAAMGYVPTSNFEGGIYSVRGWKNPHLVTYMESHDEERLMYKTLKFGNSSGTYNTRELATALKRMELNAAFFFTIPGPKMVWQFGELGYDYSINYCADGTVDNNCRVDSKPIRWDYATDQRRKQVYNVYSKLINLRFHKWYKDAFITGSTERSLSGAFKWLKVSSGDTSYLVAIGNFDVTATSGSITFPKGGTWYNYLTGATFTATGAAQTISLQPGEYNVFINRNLADTIAVVPPPPVTTVSFTAKVFPNPVRAGFTLQLQLPQAAETSVLLISTSGQTIATLTKGALTAGTHTIPLNRQALGIAAGVYFFKITTAAETRILKVTFQ